MLGLILVHDHIVINFRIIIIIKLYWRVRRVPAAPAGGHGFDSRCFSSSSRLTNVDGMKDLWCSTTEKSEVTHGHQQKLIL
jgi:hypothetical protein